MIKHYKYFLSLFTLIAAYPMSAQDNRLVKPEGDTAILFRFVPKRLMFYSPYKGNENSIEQARLLIEKHRDAIISGNAYIIIRGYCSSYATEAENRKAVKNRTNQVKSYYITLHGMKEDYYRTRNYTTPYNGIKDIVAILGIEYVNGYVPEESVMLDREAIEQLERIPAFPQTVASAYQSPEPAVDTEKYLSDKAATAPAIDLTPRVYVESPWVLKTNLLYDAMSSPSLEVEYRINDRWSVALDGNVSWWSNDSKHRFYQLANISPEGRYWFKIKEPYHGHYIGTFVGGTIYDLENKKTGYQGEGGYVGVSYGYVFPIGKKLSLEAGIGVGYMYTKFEEYLPVDQCYVYQQTKVLNYFGPLKLKLALAWRIGGYRKGGAR